MRGEHQDMFEEVKEKLLEQPESIEHILDAFGFDKIRISHKEIRCAFEPGMNPTAVVIRLQDNKHLFVKDYERNLSCDLINYLVKSKDIPFKDVMNIIKQELRLDSIYNYKRKAGLFGGLYDKISRSNSEISLTTYPEEILKQYGNTPSLLWLKDGISLSTQRKWGVGFDIESQRITLPIRTSSSELMGIKGRCNYEPDEYEAKYLYLTPSCPMSQTLFGYSENYSSLYENDVLVVESEKSVLKMDSWGYNNVVALGSNSLSTTQAKLLLSLNPKRVTFLLDKSLPLENTKRNADLLKTFCAMRQLEIRYWNWEDNISLSDKSAPCDDTKEELKYILENEIKSIEELEADDEI
jgi:DNA primase